MSYLPINKLPGSSTISGWPDFDGSNPVTSHKVNLSAVVPPSPTDDGVSGYSVGSLWVDLAANTPWICVDSTNGAALWSSGAGGSGTTDRDEFVFTSSGIVVKNVVRRTLTGWVLAQADDPTNAEVFGVAKTVVGTTVTAITNGICDFGAPHGLGSNGAALFLSPTTPGGLTTTAPFTLGQVVKPVAIIVDSTRILIVNMLGVQLVSNNLVLTNGQILVGNVANQAVGQTPSGDLTMSNAGIFTITSQAVTAAKIALLTITSSQIANATITGAKVASNTISSTNLTTTGVVAGSYTNASITVDAAGRLTVASTGASGTSSVNVQYFKVNGSWTVPTGVTKAKLRVWGGGGGGGGADDGADRYAGGGGAGGYAERYVTSLVPGTNYTVTIGTGGSGGAGTGGANGGSGGSSSIGTLCVSTGGSGGDGISSVVYGNPTTSGIGTTGDLLLRGEGGTGGNPTLQRGGDGGNSVGLMGIGGIGGTYLNAIAGSGYGYGGQGAVSASSDSNTGAPGGPGLVIVEW